MKVLILAALVAVSAGRPRFLVIPLGTSSSRARRTSPSTGCLRVWPGRRGQLRTRTATRTLLMLTPLTLPRNVMLRLLAATPTLPPTQLRVRTTLTTERTPAATAPSAGTPTTPSSSPDTETQQSSFFGRIKIFGSAQVQLLLLNIPS